ncbi:MAG TPA: hypothetical protein VK721_13060 [Solirubrobacteraceae bacterium]|jgi:hypothetical protein|nr:hypothetical protein [Solirubrobacteraceae bacterium]
MTARAKPECRVVDLTPEMAQTMLGENIRNRPIRHAYVKRLAEAMTRGEWTMNGEPIQVADDGTLLNGQHRLSAVVKSGTTIPILIVSGLPAEALRTVDTGTRRTLSDVLALRGESDTTNLAAALGLLHRYRRGSRMDQAGHTAPTAQEALSLLDHEPSLRDALRTARRLHRRNHMRQSVMAVLSYLFDEADPGEGTRFFEVLCISDDRPQSPIRALQSVLASQRADRTYRLPAYSLCAMTIKAFNAWRDDTPIALLSFKPGGKAPEPFPRFDRRPRSGQ